MIKSFLCKIRGNSVPIAAKAAFWFVFCSIIQKSLAFITVPIFTRIMSQEQYGLYALYNSFLGILMVICTLNTETAAFVNGYTKLESKEEKNKLPITLISLSATITFFIFCFFSISYSFIDQWVKLPYILVLFLFLNILYNPSLSIWTFQQRFDYKYKKLVVTILFLSLIQVVLGILFVYAVPSPDKALARVVGIVVPGVIVAAAIYLNYARRSGLYYDNSNWRSIIRLQLPLVPYNLSMVLLLSSSRIIINAFDGARSLALYSVAYSIGQIISIIKQSIVDAFHPWIYKKIINEEYEAIRELSVFLLIFLTLVAFFVSSVAPMLLVIFAPEEYYEAIYVVPFISAVVIFALFNQLFSVIMTYYEKTSFIMKSSMIACILNIVLNLIFIPLLGFAFAALSSLVSYMILCFINYFYLRKINQFKNPFNSKLIYLYPILLAAIVSSVSLLYNYTLVLVLADIIVILGILSKRNTIMKFINLRNG